MEERTIFRLLMTAVLVVLVGLAVPATAQVSTGTIEVTTNDEQNLPVPGVSVRVASVDTGARRATISDAMGLAIVPALPPGEYSVGVSLSGFATAEENVVIRIGQTGRLVSGSRCRSMACAQRADAPGDAAF